MSNKTIYEERADDLRILAGKEPDATHLRQMPSLTGKI